MEELKEKGIHLKSLSESIDTTSATGTLFFQFMCMLAEHERNIIRERTMAGLNSARARGRRGGRPNGLSQHYKLIAPEVKEMYEKNIRTTEEIRKIFKIKSQPTLYKILTFSGVDIKGFLKKQKIKSQNVKI